MFGASLSVVPYKKKIVAFLVAVAFCGTALILRAAEPTGAEPAKEAKENRNSLTISEPNFFEKSGDDLGTQELFFKMMVSVLLVIVLGVTAVYFSKKFLPKITNLPGKEIKIVETVHLGNRKTMHLVKVGSQRFLIGSTNENITKLAEIYDSFSEKDFSPSEE